MDPNARRIIGETDRHSEGPRTASDDNLQHRLLAGSKRNHRRLETNQHRRDRNINGIGRFRTRARPPSRHVLRRDTAVRQTLVFRRKVLDRSRYSASAAQGWPCAGPSAFSESACFGPGQPLRSLSLRDRSSNGPVGRATRSHPWPGSCRRRSGSPVPTQTGARSSALISGKRMICGVSVSTRSVFLSVVVSFLNKRPRKGMSPSRGVLVTPFGLVSTDESSKQARFAALESNHRGYGAGPDGDGFRITQP